MQQQRWTSTCNCDWMRMQYCARQKIYMSICHVIITHNSMHRFNWMNESDYILIIHSRNWLSCNVAVLYIIRKWRNYYSWTWATRFFFSFLLRIFGVEIILFYAYQSVSTWWAPTNVATTANVWLCGICKLSYERNYVIKTNTSSSSST